MLKKVQFKNNKKQTLRGFVHVPRKYKNSAKKTTAIVYLHGFPGHCSGTAARFCGLLAKLGFLTLRFDFSGSDTSDGKFENKLMSQEVKDVRSAIDFLEKNYEYKKLVLVGISTGAIDASLYAHTDKRVSKVVLLGAVSDLRHGVRYDFTAEQVHSFWKKGHIVYNRPEKWYHKKKLKKGFYDEFFKLSIPKAIKKYKQPLLIIHGSKDEAIPLSDPHELYEMANKPKKLVIIKGGDHQFRKLRHGLQVVWHVVRFCRK